MTTSDPGPLVHAAARGELPEWANVSEKRRAHMARVAGLMAEWAEGLGLSADDRARWAAAGWLHDALREDAPDDLRPQVPPAFRDLPGKLLHGPAAAERLAGLVDEEMLVAIRYHTLGSPRWGALGRALYLADFLEPGRRYEPEWTASLRARMPGEMEAVLREVVQARVRHVTESGSTL
ncbi:MAG TPA: HD domain-containing protein, partial [Longimicrobium sp.]|uniref:HD domain-containing protein n=1 Tax=Longimicrobium sp. TaxID=2029185 RepID=UPI002ED8803C